MTMRVQATDTFVENLDGSNVEYISATIKDEYGSNRFDAISKVTVHWSVDWDYIASGIRGVSVYIDSIGLFLIEVDMGEETEDREVEIDVKDYDIDIEYHGTGGLFVNGLEIDEVHHKIVVDMSTFG